jgi:hypothetical protein
MMSRARRRGDDRLDDESTPGAITRPLLVPLLAVAAVTTILTTLAVSLGATGSGPDATTGSGRRAAEPPAASAQATPPAATSPAATSPAPAASPSGSTTGPAPATGTASQSGSPAPTPVRAQRPEVDVLNQSGQNQLASAAVAQLRAAGWRIGRNAGFAGTVRTTTVYYPKGKRQAALAAARDLAGPTRVLERFSTLSDQRLSLVVTDDFGRGGGTRR